MANSGNVFDLLKRANDVFLAPLVVAPNLGMAMVNGAIGGPARLGEATAQAAKEAGVPLAVFAQSFSKRVADSTLSTARESIQLAQDAARKAAGGGPPESANDLLGTTAVEPFVDTSGLPFTLTFNALAAAFDVESFKKAAWEAWLLFVRGLQPLSIQGVLPGRIGIETDGHVLFGYYYGSTEGPLQAVVRDVRNILGGFLALGLGDFKTLGMALPDYWDSLEYVYDKKVNDEVQPEVNFPIAARTRSSCHEPDPALPLRLHPSSSIGRPALGSAGVGQRLRADIEPARPLSVLRVQRPLRRGGLRGEGVV